MKYVREPSSKIDIEAIKLRLDALFQLSGRQLGPPPAIIGPANGQSAAQTKTYLGADRPGEELVQGVLKDVADS